MAISSWLMFIVRRCTVEVSGVVYWRSSFSFDISITVDCSLTEYVIRFKPMM